jgi:hypothetical protein
MTQRAPLLEVAETEDVIGRRDSNAAVLRIAEVKFDVAGVEGIASRRTFSGSAHVTLTGSGTPETKSEHVSANPRAAAQKPSAGAVKKRLR